VETIQRSRINLGDLRKNFKDEESADRGKTYKETRNQIEGKRVRTQAEGGVRILVGYQEKSRLLSHRIKRKQRVGTIIKGPACKLAGVGIRERGNHWNKVNLFLNFNQIRGAFKKKSIRIGFGDRFLNQAVDYVEGECLNCRQHSELFGGKTGDY